MDIQLKPFANINLQDHFFDTLRQDYLEFDVWFNNKTGQNAKAFVMSSDLGLEAFLYLKKENGPVSDVNPPLSNATRLKIGTLKVNPHGTRIGERFIKKIFDYCIEYNIKEAYVTVFPKHLYLIQLFTKYGFNQVATKTTSNGVENVYLKSFTVLQGDLLKDYPTFNVSNVSKHLLAVFPHFHTRLFPDSILNNEHFDIIKDVSHTNSIHKVYVCTMNVSSLKPKDLLVIYRTGDGQAAAYFRAVVTSICVVEEVRRKTSFANIEDFLAYTQAYSVFSEAELREQFNSGNIFVIKMTYNAAFSKRINRKILLEEIGLNGNIRWGFMRLTEPQFNDILNKGGINESLIVNQT